ncbi:MAG: hydrolase [Micropruina sp.]|uniref:hydrolase n=1 Tax=Micropruina sp. TaxID=2737536 RepID=UPI0039E6EC99
MTATEWICRTCGVEQAIAAEPPPACAICTDERQYVLPSGPAWATSVDLVRDGYRLEVTELEPGLWGFRPEPKIGIGQTALLATGTGGNLLFDVPSLVDPTALELLRGLGGVAAIMASHPHMYGSQVAWSHALGGVPVYVAAKDARWVQRADPAIVTWDDPFEPVPGIRASQVGGHFPGQTIAHWTGADGAGVLLAGDACAVRPDGNVTFLRSYPNAIPMSPLGVRRIVAGFDRHPYRRLYDNVAGRLSDDAAAIVRFSAERYLAWISGAHDDLI